MTDTKKISGAPSAREIALKLLTKMEGSGQFSNIALDRELISSELADADRRLTTALFLGVTERRITLDARISELSSRALDTIDKRTLCILRMGIYQLMFMNKIPAHAAINETVDLADRRAAGFVNAVLRAHTRGKQMTLPDRNTDATGYMSVKYSVCRELCEKFTEQFGEARAESILASFFKVPTTSIRVNTLKVSREELSKKINGSTFTENAPHGLKISSPVRSAYGFDEGLFFVQDEASQICTEVLGASEGDTVIDTCSCPGSKTFGIALSMNGHGKIYAYDLHKSKLSLITSGAERLGIDIIEADEHDGKILIPSLVGRADRVLCDVPCSGFGVISKKPELRYKDPAICASLPEVQYSILNTAANYLKIGGTLVYSTCTLFYEENEQNVKRFLSEHTNFELCPFSVGSICAPDGYVTLTPDVHDTDGFFIAKLIKRS